jgi:PAS domain S-box-containing protein
MTDQRLSEAVQASEAFAGFSRLSVAMVLSDPNQKDNPIVYVNEAFERMTGYSRAEAVGQNCRFLQGEETDKRAVDQLRAAIEDGYEVSVDILNYRANGAPFMNRLLVAPIFGDDGKPAFFFGMQKELTEKDDGIEHRISSADLTLLQTLVKRDLATILTSLREPAAGNFSRSVRESNALPRRLETLQLVYEEMHHAADRNTRNRFDLGTLIGRVAGAIAHEEGRAGLRFVQMVESAEMKLDQSIRIALIVSETLHNTFNHAFVMQDEGRIELRVTRLSSGGVRILISDDGEGFPPNIDWPSDKFVGGRLVQNLLAGLDATLNVVRGAAGTVILLDVPEDFEN